MNALLTIVTSPAAALLLGMSEPAPASPTAVAEPPAKELIDALLDTFNEAASGADIEAYFACLAPDGVFIGTDENERWTMAQLRAFVEPYFEQGISRRHTPTARHIDLCPGDTVAYFDELIDLEGLGTSRGTGVAIQLDGEWLITQYCMSFPIPNAVVFDVSERIARYHEQVGAQPGALSIEAAVRQSLDSYLAIASVPTPGRVDPELFTADVQALWSNGRAYRGRGAVVKAARESQRELAAFSAFAAKAEDVHMRRRGNVVWLNCLLRMNGTLKDSGEDFERTIRSTLIFENNNGRWQIAAEHSNRVEGE